MKPYVSNWDKPPEIAIPNNPAFLSDCDDAWLAYECVTDSDERMFSVIGFHDVIAFNLTPINDEGLGKHRYAKLALKWFAFNELHDTAETIRWSHPQSRQFAVTFKDVTIEVLALHADVCAEKVAGADGHDALHIAIDASGRHRIG